RFFRRCRFCRRCLARTLNIDMSDLHRVLWLAIAVGTRCPALARLAGDLLHQLDCGRITLAENGVAAVGSSAPAHAAVGIKTRIEKRQFLLSDEELRTVCVRSAVRHGQSSWLIEQKIRM